MLDSLGREREVGIVVGVIVGWAISALPGCASPSPEPIATPVRSDPIQLIHDPLTIIWMESTAGAQEPYIRVGNEFIHLAPGERIGDPGLSLFDDTK